MGLLKNKLKIIFLATIIVFGFFLLQAKSVKAVCGCCNLTGNCTQSCTAAGCTETCHCTSGNDCDCLAICGPGTHVTNNSCAPNGPACFLPGTKVQTPNGDKNIEDVKIGDVVFTFANDLISKSTVINTLKSNRNFYYSLEAGSYKVDVAAEHRFYVGNGDFTEVQHLSVGDTVYVMEGMKLAKKAVTKVVRVDKSSDVYNLTINKTQTYFANDFAVHNLKCFCGQCGQDCTGNPEKCHARCCDHPDPNSCVGQEVWPHPIVYCPAGQHKVEHPESKQCGFCYGCTLWVQGSICGGTASQPIWWSIPYTCEADCVKSKPKVAISQSPEDGATFSTTTVQLSWDRPDPPNAWGKGCPNTNKYAVFVRVSGGTYTKVYDGTGKVYNFTGAAGTKYDWIVRTKNGGGSAYIKDTPVRSFTINASSSPAWWQVKDSDLSVSGILSSLVPNGSLFDLAPVGGFPGVPAYADSTNLTSANVSATHWLANSQSLGQKIYNYDYFANQIPADILANDLNVIQSNSIEGTDLAAGGKQDANGYYWYKYDGTASGLDLTLNSAADLASRKVILLVDTANFNINAPINLTDGEGFFMVIVKGNINIDKSVGGGAAPSLEGIYVADKSFIDGTTGLKDDLVLYVRGSVVDYETMSMQRDIGGVGSLTNPSEFFEYAPDQIMLLPKAFATRKINWKEVAP